MLFLAACGGAPAASTTGTASTSATAAGASDAVATDDTAEITVWVDTTRLDGVKLYQTKHPDAKLKIVTVDRGQFPSKVTAVSTIPIKAGPMSFLPSRIWWRRWPTPRTISRLI